MTHDSDILTAFREQSHGLIRSEIFIDEQRANLERALHDAVNKLGLSVDDLSEATGIHPDEIRRIASVAPDLTLPRLMGVA